MAQAETLTHVRTPAPLQMPQPVREAWGDAATDAFTDWMSVGHSFADHRNVREVELVNDAIGTFLPRR